MAIYLAFLSKPSLCKLRVRLFVLVTAPLRVAVARVMDVFDTLLVTLSLLRDTKGRVDAVRELEVSIFESSSRGVY